MKQKPLFNECSTLQERSKENVCHPPHLNGSAWQTDRHYDREVIPMFMQMRHKKCHLKCGIGIGVLWIYNTIIYTCKVTYTSWYVFKMHNSISLYRNAKTAKTWLFIRKATWTGRRWIRDPYLSACLCRQHKKWCLSTEGTPLPVQ